MVQSRSGRDHPLAKGGSLFEETPTNPPPSHTAAIFVAALALGTAAYASAGFINSGIDRLLSSPVIPIADVPSHTSNNIVNLGYASYRGLRNETVPSVVSWLGVPYAQPPRRFRAAQPLDETPREHNLKDLVRYPPFCVQGWAPWAGAEDRGGAGSEDCLFLNIYAPNIATNTSSLPVLVYIHGGGYHNGNPRAWPFDNWVERSSTPFVAVSVYYRLSSLGFLAAPEGPDKGPRASLNAGLHDQRMALRFIQRHIHSFGGDPKRVTIMGQSAGAGSVGSHIVAQNENPDEQLFHRAILQSWYRAPLLNPAGRKTVWNYLINRVGCSHWSWGLSRTLQCLREVDHVKLIQAADEGMAKHPTHDSVLSHATFSELAKATYPKLSSADIRMLENTYSQTDIAPEDIPEVAMSEAMFRCSSHFIGNKQGPRVYAYRFDEPDPVNYERAGHSADNYIMFEGTRTGSNGSVTFNPLTPSQRVLSDELISYFVKFAATGNPNAPHSMTDNVQATLAHASDAQEHISPIWPTYDTGKRIVFRAPEGGTGTSRGVPGATHIEEFDENEIERCKVWESLTEAIQI
ncbi:carbohydrate esterase family 10 protein [Rhizoctonia solani]|uniref:Carboxylic ester hydrolase n=1 Tax=Rhizoctonia solani TaxID=456999 RepID=A0A8H8T1Y4_9AGAM|nr:carbohydrate esterase family 10 protein [Rhizoctonia solani]QRW25824.1 carbohydrate esterase family 10 protein [Rhizoctonia solani]